MPYVDRKPVLYFFFTLLIFCKVAELFETTNEHVVSIVYFNEVLPTCSVLDKPITYTHFGKSLS